MSLLAPRRHVDEAARPVHNADLLSALAQATRRSLTGALEVTDRETSSVARLYIYEGGLYAVDLGGYRCRVYARLQCSGAFANRSTAELALLTGLDAPNPQAVASAVQQGWLSADGLAGVHREFALAGLGAALTLGKVKIRERRGQTTSQFCTLPLPLDSVLAAVQMRADRMVETWSTVAPGSEPGSATLVRTGVSNGRGTLPNEMRALESAIDGMRSLDELAWSLGFTRAEAVHVASILIGVGAVRIEVPGPQHTLPDYHLVPESFGSRPVDDRAAPVVAPLATVTALDSRRIAPIDDVAEREQRLIRARAEVERLQAELQRSLRAEQAAINHAAEVGQQLREARVAVARIEIAEAVPLGIA